jgi:hypothetical protein
MYVTLKQLFMAKHFSFCFADLHKPLASLTVYLSMIDPYSGHPEGWTTLFDSLEGHMIFRRVRKIARSDY